MSKMIILLIPLIFFTGFTMISTASTNILVDSASSSAMAPEQPSLKLQASFTSNVESGYAPLDVVFTDTSTGTPTSWYWDFGDGNRSTDQNPTHTYYRAGMYNVRFGVMNDAGESSEISKYFQVLAVANEQPQTTSAQTPEDIVDFALQFIQQHLYVLILLIVILAVAAALDSSRVILKVILGIIAIFLILGVILFVLLFFAGILWVIFIVAGFFFFLAVFHSEFGG